jgi:hypothetical protein
MSTAKTTARILSRRRLRSSGMIWAPREWIAVHESTGTFCRITLRMVGGRSLWCWQVEKATQQAGKPGVFEVWQQGSTSTPSKAERAILEVLAQLPRVER